MNSYNSYFKELRIKDPQLSAEKLSYESAVLYLSQYCDTQNSEQIKKFKQLTAEDTPQDKKEQLIEELIPIWNKIRTNQCITRSEKRDGREIYKCYCFISNNMGKFGNAYEASLRGLLNPDTAIIKRQKNDRDDFIFVDRKNGLRVKAEIKTACGDLVTSFYATTDTWRQMISPEIFKWQYLLYCYDYCGDDTDIARKTYVFTPQGWLRFNELYNGSNYCLMRYDSRGKRIMINFAAKTSKKMSKHFSLISKYADTIEGIYTLKTFVSDIWGKNFEELFSEVL